MTSEKTRINIFAFHPYQVKGFLRNNQWAWLQFGSMHSLWDEVRILSRTWPLDCYWELWLVTFLSIRLMSFEFWITNMSPEVSMRMFSSSAERRGVLPEKDKLNSVCLHGFLAAMLTPNMASPLWVVPLVLRVTFRRFLDVVLGGYRLLHRFKFMKGQSE